MMPKQPSIFLLLFLFCTTKAYAYQLDSAGIYKLLKSNNEKEINAGLLHLAYFQKYKKGNEPLADSLAKKALLNAHSANDENAIIETTVSYAQLCMAENIPNAIKFLTEARELAQKQNNTKYLFDCNLTLATMWLNAMHPASAAQFIQTANDYTEDYPDRKAKYYIVLAEYQHKSKEKINSFGNYNNALFYAKKSENDSLTIQSYLRLFEFFLLNGKYTKAKEYLKICEEFYTSSQYKNTYDSLLIKASLVEIYTYEDNDDLALNLADNLILFSKSQGYTAMEDRVFAVLRRHYLSKNKNKEICELYDKKYSAELERLRSNDPIVYFRVKSLIYESLNQQDSAVIFLNEAENLILLESNPANISNFYKRKGQYYLRNHKIDVALQAFLVCNKYALESHYYPFIIESAGILDSLYYAQGNVNLAYAYNTQKLKYIDSNNALLQNDQLSEIEIENNLRLQKLEQEKEEILNTRKSNFQVMIIVIAILFSLIVLVLLSNYKIPASIVKGFGYMTFVLVFEFIIYLLDTKIHHWAHGQPLKILTVKICIIAIILPIHHATEHRVVHYLLRNKLITQGGTSLRTAWANIKAWVSDVFKKQNATEEKDSAESSNHTNA